MLFWMARFHVLPKINKKFELHFQVGGGRAAGKANMKKIREKKAACLQCVPKVFASDTNALLLAVGFPREDECKLGYPAWPIR
jgi:hypothetical protein